VVKVSSYAVDGRTLNATSDLHSTIRTSTGLEITELYRLLTHDI